MTQIQNPLAHNPQTGPANRTAGGKPTGAKSRLGLHYYPDTFHYREQDLATWLAELQALGVGWLTLIAPSERAIPEDFIRGLVSAGIQPVLHFPIPLNQAGRDLHLNVLFENYGRWGVKYSALFDRPNLRSSWPAAAWAQTDLVERFLDFFLPHANAALQSGLAPVFAPLEPGGDYWDTAFLQTALRSMERRGQHRLVESLGLSAFAWTNNQPLDWGAGGPERWPASQPYYTPPNSQDQLGFRIFDWYQAIAQAETGLAMPIILLRAGSRLEKGLQGDPGALQKHAEQNLAIAELLSKARPEVKSPTALFSAQSTGEEELPDETLDSVLCANFWLLSADPESPYVSNAWYQPQGGNLPVVNALKQWSALQGKPAETTGKGNPEVEISLGAHPIEHYLLLPLYAWGVADWDLEAIKPFLQQHHPTVGFSVYEARLARRVTIFGEGTNLSPDSLTILRLAGCQVERLGQDGTLLAQG